MLGTILLVLAAIAAEPAAGKDFWTAAAEGDFEALAPERQTIAIDELDPVNGWTPLIYAALSGRVDAMELLLLRGAQVNRVGADGSTALAAAAARGHLDAVKFLLQRGADVNRFEGAGQTPLNWAICRGRTEVGRFLLQVGADPESGNRTGFSPLHEAAKHGNVEAIQYLIDAGVEPGIVNDAGCPPMMFAAMHGRIEAVKALLSRGADPTGRSWENSSLGAAIENGHDEVALELMRAGADLNLDLNHEDTAVVEACKAGRLELARAFRAAGSELGDIDSIDMRATAEAGHEECVALLIDMGAKLNAPDVKDLLEKVTKRGYVGMAALLFRANRTWSGAPTTPSHEREDRLLRALRESDDAAMRAVLDEEPVTNKAVVETAIELAALHGEFRMHRWLRSYVGRVNDEVVTTATALRELLVACQEGDTAAVERLLAAGVSPTGYDADERASPIIAAAEGGHPRIVRLLLGRGADANDSRGWGPPVLSVVSHVTGATPDERLEALQVLLNAGAKPEVAGRSHSPLFTAARTGNLEAARLLLDSGADPMFRSEDAQLPLSAATKVGSVGIVRLLLERGAHVDALDDHGCSARDYARGYLRDEVDKLLATTGGRLTGTRLPSPLASMVDGDPALFRSYLDRGVDPNSVDPDVWEGWPLKIALEYGELKPNRLANARLLIERGANLDPTPVILHQLVTNDNQAGARELLRLMHERGVNVNRHETTYYYGDTPLIFAVRQQATEIETISLLIELGADPRLRNSQGESALDLARKHHPEAVNLIEECLNRLPQHGDSSNL